MHFFYTATTVLILMGIAFMLGRFVSEPDFYYSVVNSINGSDKQKLSEIHVSSEKTGKEDSVDQAGGPSLHETSVSVDGRLVETSTSTSTTSLKEIGRYDDRVRIPINVDDVAHVITLDSRPTLLSVYSQAKDFITTYTPAPDDEQMRNENVYKVTSFLLKSLRQLGVQIFNPNETSVLFVSINSVEFPLTVKSEVDGPNVLYRLMPEAIEALCVEYYAELGVSAATHEDCVKILQTQVAPIVANAHKVPASEFFEVPINFSGIETSSIPVRVNNGLMEVVNAAETFVTNNLKVTDPKIASENVFLLSQFILSTLRSSQQSIITKSIAGELNAHTATIELNETIKLPVTFDISHEEKQARRDAAAAFCIEFSNILALEREKLQKCIDEIVVLTNSVTFLE